MATNAMYDPYAAERNAFNPNALYELAMQNAPRTVDNAVYQTFGMQPGMDRLNFLPRYDSRQGWIAPNALYQVARALVSPGVAAQGGNVSPEDGVNFAGNVSLGAIGAGHLAPPTGPGRTVGIVSPARARELPYQTSVPDHAEFSAAVANTPGAQITPDGLLMRVARKQASAVEGDEAIRTGVFYLPEGDKRMSFYGGKNGYGGDQKFTGETLFKRPIFVKGATGGKAPENAYDQLLGKGSYERMRSDVLGALRYGVPYKEKVAAVRDVLAKYGGNPNMADSIVHASNGGNTLPYAIQEHIVAHAVRNAGYDSVLGFSKAKTGPFISEVFDVREQTYPSNFGNTQIHDKFTGE